MATSVQETTAEKAANEDYILEVKNVKKHFRMGGGMLSRGNEMNIRAVDDISFSIRRGETFGLVGESGCGKTTLGQTIIRLYNPTAGQIVFNNADISTLNAADMRKHRRGMQMIFQDPSASLDPRMTVGSIISEPLNIFGIGSREERRDRVRELLRVVGLNAYFVNRYPHEFSGGQRQRIGIARALALQPELVICDEPVSALDVSVQAQVLNLLRQLQTDFKLTYLFIAHNLAVVAHISDRVGVMYLGKMVEIGEARAITERPKHPYTQALISAIPVVDPGRKRDRIILEGDVPSPANPPSGCRFHPRCPIAQPYCSEVEPQLRELEPGHWVACHYAE
ncbi:MAG TPA: ABC transporter ATP-binding protein [Thermomicrobiales bacterium]|nr:ABC transporter ATP-binding protein [Thermomicrobiales bacterium]HRA30345.1 ABC transporter ATP-binding protein [Thermomicrobiales bacterium]